jgi:ArsR family transcriptional regulator, virulence genes transcriptional regulator
LDKILDEAVINQASMLLSALENPKRLEILQILVEGEQSVNKLAVRVGLSQSALSQHLNKLRQARLVETRRDAQTIYYLCRSAAVQHMLRVLDEIFPAT